jgi:hypothetical protein
MMRQARLHRGSDAQCLVNPAKVVMHEVKRNSGLMVFNGTQDWGATLSGCTVQAHSTLNGMAVTFTTYETINTELELPDLYPNIFINPS